MSYQPERQYQYSNQAPYAQQQSQYAHAPQQGFQNSSAQDVHFQAGPHGYGSPTSLDHASLPDTRQAYALQYDSNTFAQHTFSQGQFHAPSNYGQQQRWQQMDHSGQQAYHQPVNYQQQPAQSWQQISHMQQYDHRNQSFARPASQHNLNDIQYQQTPYNSISDGGYHQSLTQQAPTPIPNFDGSSGIPTLKSSGDPIPQARRPCEKPPSHRLNNNHAQHSINLPLEQLAEQSPNVYAPASSTSTSYHTAKSQHTQLPPMKRRKSNDGTAVAVAQHREPAPVPNRIKAVQAPIPSSSPLSELRSSQVQPPSPQDTNLSEVMLALADEYMYAAHSMSASLCSTSTDANDLQHYQRLVSSAIACLEGILQNFRYPDQRKEARVRIRLAIILYEETENTDKAEEILSKGIATCESNRLYDLKYSMQHLFLRNLHESNAKAASKALEKAISEVEMLGLRHWQYAFRFLRVSFGMQSNTPSDLSTSLKHLQSIQQLADVEGDTSIRIMCACLEALTHFRAGSRDDLEAAQQSMAAARSFQLSSEMKAMPQMQSLLNCLHMLNQVPQFTSDAMFTAMKEMHPEQNSLSKATQWTKDGCFSLPLRAKSSEHTIADTNGIFAEIEGHLAINVRWLTSADMMTLCYVLSGIATLPKNGERSEAEKFLHQALKINKMSPIRTKSSLRALNADNIRRQEMEHEVKYLLACALAGRAKYADAQKIVRELFATVSAERNIMQTRLRYVNALCEQGLGRLEKALELYGLELAGLHEDAKVAPLIRDIQIIVGLSSVHIMRQLGRPGVDVTLDLLEPLCLEHTNRNFASAYHVVHATVEYANATIIDTKHRLSHALQPAQNAKNQQLLAIIMNMMTEVFFTDIVGVQAQKSAHAAHAIAAKSGDPLWKAVGLGMYRETLERMGEAVQASEMNLLAQKAVSSLPHDVKKILALD